MSIDPQPAKQPVPFLDRYEIRGPLGSGGFGLTLLAHDNILDREVVLKVPRSAKRAKEEIEGCQARIRAGHHDLLADIYHVEPNCPVSDFPPHIVLPDNMPETIHVIVMEYVPGDTLKVHLEMLVAMRRTFDVVRLLQRVLAQGLELLKHFDDTRVRHGDIHWRNLMVLPDGRIKLIDFGTACRYGEDRSLHLNPRMHPAEEITGHAEFIDPKDRDVAGDLYMLGLTLLKCLEAAGLPFFSELPIEARGKPVHLAQQTLLDHGYGQQFCEALQTILDPNPVNRRDALSIKVDVVSSEPPAPRFTRRAVAAWVLLAAGVTAGAFLLTGSKDPQKPGAAPPAGPAKIFITPREELERLDASRPPS